MYVNYFNFVFFPDQFSKISPEFYGFMTHHLKSLANGKVVVALEGGYNLNSISLSMTMVTKALLGDPMPHLAPYKKPLESAIKTVSDTMKSIAPYWSCLKYGVKLPQDMNSSEINLKDQMAKKAVDFIKDNFIIKEGTIDYIPGQFGAYASTFGINTLSDIKTVKTVTELKTLSSKEKAETIDLLNEAMKNITIDQNNSDTKKSPTSNTETEEEKTKNPKNPDVYIPSQYQGIHGQSASINTVSLSSTPSTANTTDSQKKN